MSKARITLRLMIFLTTLTLLGCGSSGSGSQTSSTISTDAGTGAITVNLVWNNTSATATKAAASSLPAGVVTIRITVSAADMTNSIKQSLSASSGRNTITGVPVGTNRTLTVEALDATGVLSYKGSANNITVVSGQTTDAGTITMASLTSGSTQLSYHLVDTNQSTCYDGSGNVISCPTLGQDYYGQDAQTAGTPASYTDNGDGTVTDNVTGLMWQQTPSTSRYTITEALANAATLKLGGYTDWRLPTIKELLSIAQFSGSLPNKKYYFDSNYFKFNYSYLTAQGLTSEMGQFWADTPYVGLSMGHSGGYFMFNLTDGHIKVTQGPNWTMYVRGPSTYGINNFVDNGDNTVTDKATGLMWAKNDSGTGMDWKSALAWVQAKNTAKYLGYNDWRLPNAKELQSIVDYTHSPSATDSAKNGPAIDTKFFNITKVPITVYPYFWSSTTHGDSTKTAIYVCFGLAATVDTATNGLESHGAGAMRSDIKIGDPSNYSSGLGPSPADLVVINNFVRLVRNAP